MNPHASLDRTLGALADPSRRAILSRLAEGEARVTDLAAPFSMSLAGVSKHVRVLEDAGLVTRRIAGREHWLAFTGEPLVEAASWIDFYRRFWERRLDQLHRLLQQRKPEARKSGNRKAGN